MADPDDGLGDRHVDAVGAEEHPIWGQVPPPPTVSPEISQRVSAILDAAERLLIEVGYAGITTRLAWRRVSE